MQEHPPDDFALVDACRAVRVKFLQGRRDILGSGGHPQGLEGLDQFRLLLGDRLTVLAGFRLGRLPPFPVEQDRLPVVADAGLPDFQTLLLQFQIENRTLT